MTVNPPPILLLLYNRPDTTKIVLDAIRKVRPSKLYVAADGPSAERDQDYKKCSEARALIDTVDWDCEVTTLFREENLGCRKAVSSAVSWFFEHVDQGIILEDDCLPSQSFFLFCQELLEFYKDDPSVMAITGNNFQEGRRVSNESYYFSRYPHCWGWASWRRAWGLYETDMKGWEEYRHSDAFREIGDNRSNFNKYWTSIYDRVSDGQIDSWAYVWTYSCWRHAGLTAIPEKNLVKNIGFGEGATHTKVKDERIEALQAEELEFPLTHPQEVTRNIQADLFSDRCHFGIQNDDYKPSRMSYLIFKFKNLLLIPFNLIKKVL